MREQRGMHLGMLAATLRVPVRKLEALEADRLEELGNVAFTRALAQAVCRVLKVDPAPVLAALPQPLSELPALTEISNRQLAGFEDPAPRRVVGHDRTVAAPSSRLLAWAALGLVVAAVAAWWLPKGSLRDLETPAPSTAAAPETSPKPLPGSSGGASGDVTGATAPSAEAGPARDVAAPGQADTSAQAVSPRPAASSPDRNAGAAAASAPGVASMQGPAAQAATGERAAPASLTARASSWIEVTDAQQRVLVSRILAPGEVVALEGRPPWRLVIGNAAGTEVRLRGQPVDLGPHTRDNVARLELN